MHLEKLQLPLIVKSLCKLGKGKIPYHGKTYSKLHFNGETSGLHHTLFMNMRDAH